MTKRASNTATLQDLVQVVKGCLDVGLKDSKCTLTDPDGLCADYEEFLLALARLTSRRLAPSSFSQVFERLFQLRLWLTMRSKVLPSKWCTPCPMPGAS